MIRRHLRVATLIVLVATGAAVSPSELDSDLEVTRLANDLRSLMGMYRWRKAEWGVLVVSLDRGDTLFATGAATPMAPASNMKLLTTAAALSSLGPDFRYTTYLVSDGVVENGVLHGDLTLYGTGDPGLSNRFFPSRTSVFESLVDQLAELGIREVEGDLIGDASFFPGPLRPGGWDPADLNDHFAPGVSALSFNENVVSIRVEPAATAGLPPIVHTLPDHASLDVDNASVTVEGRPRERLIIMRDHPDDPIRIAGQIQRGARDVWRQLTVTDPAGFALSVFESVLVERGVSVTGNRHVVSTPGRSPVGGSRVTAPVRLDRPRTRVLARHASPPLRDYLEVVN